VLEARVEHVEIAAAILTMSGGSATVAIEPDQESPNGMPTSSSVRYPGRSMRSWFALSHPPPPLSDRSTLSSGVFRAAPSRSRVRHPAFATRRRPAD